MKNIKVMVTKLNTPWGIIQNPQTANVYKHVIDFPDVTKRNEFIANQLFGGTSLTDIMGKVSVKGSNAFGDRESVLNTRLKLSVADVSAAIGETDQVELMNKDYAVVEYTDSKGLTKHLWYALSGGTKMSNGTMVEFAAELDIFFTYKIEMKNNDVFIDRTHVDRFIEENGELKFNFTEDSFIHTLEPMDAKYIKGVPVKYEDIKQTALDLNENSTQFRALNQLRWAIFYINTSSDVGGTVVKDTIINITTESGARSSIKIPYKTIIAPLDSFGLTGNTIHTMLTNETDTPVKAFSANGVYEGIQELESSAIQGAQIVQFCPFDITTDIGGFKWADNVSLNIQTGSIQFDFRNINSNLDGDELISPVQISRNLWGLAVSSPLNMTDCIPINVMDDPEITFAPKEIKKLVNEPKLQKYPYKKLKLKTQYSSGYVIQPEMLYGEELKLKAGVGYTSEEAQSYLIPHDCGIFKTPEESMLNDMVALAVINGTLPLSSTAWADYVASKSVSATSGYSRNQALGVATGAFSIATGVATGATTGNFKGVTSGISTLNGVLDAQDQRGDIDHSPDTLKDNGSSMITQLSKGNTDFRLVTEELILKDKQQVYDLLYSFGYSYQQFGKFSDIYNNRYYFQHFQIKDVFNNLNMEVNADIKKIIADSFSDGITFWYYRDKDTWEGVLNYNYENIEMKYINQNKSIGVKKDD